MTKPIDPLSYINHLLKNGILIEGQLADKINRHFDSELKEPLILLPEDVGNLTLCFPVRNMRKNKSSILISNIAEIKNDFNATLIMVKPNANNDSNLHLFDVPGDHIKALWEYYTNINQTAV